MSRVSARRSQSRRLPFWCYRVATHSNPQTDPMSQIVRDETLRLDSRGFCRTTLGIVIIVIVIIVEVNDNSNVIYNSIVD